MAGEKKETVSPTTLKLIDPNPAIAQEPEEKTRAESLIDVGAVVFKGGEDIYLASQYTPDLVRHVSKLRFYSESFSCSAAERLARIISETLISQGARSRDDFVKIAQAFNAPTVNPNEGPTLKTALFGDR